ncbi:hypothetical protein [Rhizobium miluonense]|uniref:Ribose transport system permease protein n=1 Tax=Rhizobium miluonense TaxID=411945 RepID=A0A1C3V6H9_9HYPH|nr:hypothetical protein [Rhizobium miluonense]SCB23301.1 hypothetical protein GA0061102_100955 [Rhizobium miluonense]
MKFEINRPQFLAASSTVLAAPATTRQLWPFFAMAMALLLAASFIPALTLY